MNCNQVCSFFCGVGLLVPFHHLVDILVVLLETCELLLDEDATTVVKVVSWHALNVLHAVPAVHSCLLKHEAILGVQTSEHSEDEQKPEGTILQEVHVAIVVHWLRWLGDLKVFSVADHESLELD